MPEPDPPCDKTRKSPPRFGTQSTEASRTGQWIPAESVAPASGSPTNIGKFEIRGTLGKGAFGLVYRGYDPELHRDVAIKVPHGAGMLPDLRERFLREARAAANIHHPNVCPVYDVGTEGDIPYIVMHFVPGPTLAGVLKQRQTPFPTRHAAAIVRKLALGVAAAHANGVIHRDLKPANVLVNDVSREVLITDFGLARFSSESPLSVQGDVLGTPAYMSPEQGRGDVDAIGPPSDIYSLGVILYHLVTGTVPFRGTILELMVQLERATPKLPSVVHPGIDPAIDAICLKALAKAPGDRFGSAKEFANALADFLRGISPSEELVPHSETVVPTGAIPVPASPPAPVDEFDHLGTAILATRGTANDESVEEAKPRRSSKRSKPRKRTEKSSGYRPVVLLALLIVVLIGGLFGGVRLMRSAKKPEEQSNNEKTEVKKGGAKGVEPLTIPKGTSEKPPPTEKPPLTEKPPSTLAPKPVPPLAGGQQFVPPGVGLTNVMYSRDGKYAAVGGLDRLARLWDVDSRKVLQSFKGHGNVVWSVALSPDGKTVLTGGEDKTIRFWDASSGQEQRRFTAGATFSCVRFSPNGTLAAATNWDGKVRIWKMPGAVLQGEFAYDRATLDLAFTPDGKRFVVGTSTLGIVGGQVLVCDIANGKVLRSLLGHSGDVHGVAIVDDGKRVLSASHDRTIRLWDVETGREERTFRGHTGFVHEVRMLPDGKRFVSGGEDKTLRLWDLETGRELACSIVEGGVRGISVSPDGKTCLSAIYDGTLRLWELPAAE